MVKTKQYKENRHQEDDDCDSDSSYEEETTGIFSEEKLHGDEFMAVKPWKGAIKQPSDFKFTNNMSVIPKSELELDYVFGYRAKDCRNNIKIMKNGNLVYNAAALGIVLDITSNT